MAEFPNVRDRAGQPCSNLPALSLTLMLTFTPWRTLSVTTQKSSFDLLMILGALGQLDMRVDAVDAHAPCFIAAHGGYRRGGDGAGLILEFAQREQQAGGHAIGHRSGQQSRRIGSTAATERSGFVGHQVGYRSFIELDAEHIVRFLLHGNAEAGGFAHVGNS
jgi:hypothetical protein